MEADLFIGKRILIIGEDHQNFQELKSILEKTCATLIHAEKRIDAVSVCKDINPDIIILDHHHPQTENYHEIKKILALQPGRCFLVLSEEDVKADTAFLQALGCASVLVKPVSGPRLIEAITRFFHYP